MSQHEAKQYVDVIVEQLHEWGIISDQKYDHMTENQREELADKLVERSEQ